MHLSAKIKSALAIAALMAGTNALAQSQITGLFLEPGFSYQHVGSNLDYSGAGAANSSAINRGFGVLARGGVHILEQFFIAADARYAMLTFEDNANNFSSGATSWDIAPVIGWQMQESGARLFVGYVLGGNLDPQSANDNDMKFENPNGWRAGAGIKLHQFSVNIEWQQLRYASAKVVAANGTTRDLTYNADGLVASLTFPIEFR